MRARSPNPAALGHQAKNDGKTKALKGHWRQRTPANSFLTTGDKLNLVAKLDGHRLTAVHAVMLLPCHSLPLRAPASFNASAKLGMCHQHVLVFYCGGKSPKAELLHHPGLKNAMRPQAWA